MGWMETIMLQTEPVYYVEYYPIWVWSKDVKNYEQGFGHDKLETFFIQAHLCC